jgi:hypothetical protein
VSKEDLTIMRGKIVETLYFLQSSIVAGSAAIAAPTSDADVMKL